MLRLRDRWRVHATDGGERWFLLARDAYYGADLDLCSSHDTAEFERLAQRSAAVPTTRANGGRESAARPHRQPAAH